MTQDEIIWQNEVLEMAIKAGARQMVSSLTHPNGPVTALKFDLDSESIEAFAKLVASAAIAKEREACLKICEAQASTNYWEGADVCAEAIRARGEA